MCWAAKVWSRHINYSGVSRQCGRVRACVPVPVLLICCNCCNCQMSRCGHCHCCPASGPTLRTTLPLHTALWVLTCTIIKRNTCFWWWYVLIAIYPDADTACCRLASVPHYALHCHCTAHCAMGTNNLKCSIVQCNTSLWRWNAVIVRCLDADTTAQCVKCWYQTCHRAMGITQYTECWAAVKVACCLHHTSVECTPLSTIMCDVSNAKLGLDIESTPMNRPGQCTRLLLRWYQQ